MDFYEYMGKKIKFMFHNQALTYVSTEGEPAIKAYEAELMGTSKKKGRKSTKPDSNPVSEKKNQEEFEAMKKKIKNIVLGMIAVIVAAVAGLVIYKSHCMR